MGEPEAKRARRDLDREALDAGAGRMPPAPPLAPPLGGAPASPLLRQLVVDAVRLRDVRFHTSKDKTGSDARSKDPDYSCVYAEVTFAAPGRSITGVGIAFSLGRGTELLLQAARLLARGLRGLSLGDFADHGAAAWRRLVGCDDGQLLWLGPERGCVHQASACLVNAVWDAWAKAEQKPVWRLVADLSPQQLAAQMDLQGVQDLLGTQQDVVKALEACAAGKPARVRDLERAGVKCYTTATGWAGYPDSKVEELVKEALAQGFTQFKMKVGLGASSDRHRAELIRGIIDKYPSKEPCELMMDANSVWEVKEAVERMKELADLKPTWIEEPLSPDDILGAGEVARALAASGIAVANGEQSTNKVMMKQFLQSGLGVCQADGVKMGGLNEWLVCALMAHAQRVPVCPHAGGVGLCNMAAHLSCIDFASLSGQREKRTTEYIDHLQEHFLHPVQLLEGQGRYAAPQVHGWGLDMKPETLAAMEYPNGTYWAQRPGHFEAAGTPW